jgi:hypothetical protein
LRRRWKGHHLVAPFDISIMRLIHAYGERIVCGGRTLTLPAQMQKHTKKHARHTYGWRTISRPGPYFTLVLLDLNLGFD